MSTVVVDSAKVAGKGKKPLPSRIRIMDEEIIFSSIIGEVVYFRLPKKSLDISWKSYLPFFRNVLTSTIKGFIIFYAIVYIILGTIIFWLLRFILPPGIINITEAIMNGVAWKHVEVFIMFFIVTYIVLWLINIEVILKTEKEELHIYGKRWKLKPLMLLSEK